MTNYLLDYWKLIENNEIVVGYWIREEVKNLVSDLDNPKYIYDTTHAHKRIKFMETCCLQSKAPYYGKPMQLMPWELAFIEALYSFKLADTGVRRFIEALLEIGRKNGKTSLMAGDGLFDLFVGEGGVDICCASNDDRQARLCWEEMAGMRSRLDPKCVITRQNLTKIYNHLKNITVLRLSSKTQNKDGFNLKKIYLDESHDISEANGTSEVAEAGWRSMSSQEEPLFINCTTNGFNRDCYLDKKLLYCKKVITGEIDDDRMLPFIFEQDSEQEIWQNEKSWEKANPSLRYGIKKIIKLRRDVEAAKHDKATRIHLLAKDFNITMNNAEAWLMDEDYNYQTEEFSLDDFRGASCLGFVDLSATTDLSSAKILLMRKGDDTKYVYSHYWIPESKLNDSDDSEAGAKYTEWARSGLLTINDGNEVDISSIGEWFYGLYRKHGIIPYMVGYDQRFSKPFLDVMEHYNLDVVMILQGRALSNAMKLAEAELKAKIVNYNNHAMDKWCLGNCSIKVDNQGYVMPVKITESKRIDGAVTLIGLFEVYRRYQQEFRMMLK